MEVLFAEFCRENDLNLALSYEMPVGYEEAFGTYDIVKNTLFLNREMIRDGEESLFYLYHELRHAMQYLQPEKFDEQIQKSRFYVILYNGQCYKLGADAWKECTLQGSDFSCAYLSLPYELDANRFAYERVKALRGDTQELQELYRFWLPEKKMEYSELEKLFAAIDSAASW